MATRYATDGCATSRSGVPPTASAHSHETYSGRVIRPPGNRWPTRWAYGPSAVGPDLGAILGPADVERAVLVDAPVGVRAEEVAQALDQRGRPALAAVAVVVRQRRGERRHRDAAL